jgi:hypothetical protein
MIHKHTEESKPYVHIEYPKVMRHPALGSRTVNSEQEEAALEAEWSSGSVPAPLAPVIFDYKEEVQQLLVQLAAVSKVAVGDDPEQKLREGDYAYSQAYRDVADLRTAYEQLSAEVKTLRAEVKKLSKGRGAAAQQAAKEPQPEPAAEPNVFHAGSYADVIEPKKG